MIRRFERTGVIKLFLAVTGQDKNAARADGLRGLHIAQPVAYDGAKRQIQFEIFSRAQQQTGLGFSAIATLPVRRFSGCGMVRAEINAINSRSVKFKFRLHLGVNLSQKFFAEKSASYAGLIGDDDHQPAGFVDQPDCFSREIEKPELGQIAYVTDLFIQSPVAVNEDGSAQIFRFAGFVHFAGILNLTEALWLIGGSDGGYKKESGYRFIQIGSRPLIA